MGDSRISELNTGLQIGSRCLVALEQIIDTRCRLLDESNDDGLRSRLDRQLQFQGRLAALLAATDVIVRNRFEIQECDALAIEAHLQLLAFGGATILRSKIDLQ